MLAGVAALTALLLRSALSPYGVPVGVLVATEDLAVGTSLRPGMVVSANWPSALLPPGPPATRADLDGARLTMGVTAGTVLTRAHLHQDGPLAGLRQDAVAVPVPAGLLRGALTDVRLDLATVSGDGTGRTIARDVRVLAVDADTVWLEVERGRAADVAAAASRGTLSGAVLPD